MVVSWTWNNNTVTTTIERVFIWGPYDGWADGTGDTGFTMAHSMTPSLGKSLFVLYTKERSYPERIPLKTKDGNAHPGWIEL